MHEILNGEPLDYVYLIISTWGRKWQKGMWYTE